MEWLHTLHTVYLALHGVYPPYGVAAHPLVDLSIRSKEGVLYHTLYGMRAQAA